MKVMLKFCTAILFIGLLLLIGIVWIQLVQGKRSEGTPVELESLPTEVSHGVSKSVTSVTKNAKERIEKEERLGMAAHCFNPQVDVVYDPDDAPSVYLSAEQVRLGFEGIACESQEDYLAKEYIDKIETAQRNHCLGLISPEENSRICTELNEQFRVKFKKWLYQSDFAQTFYERINPQAN